MIARARTIASLSASRDSAPTKVQASTMNVASIDIRHA